MLVDVWQVRDIRFPTSDHLDGSDAMNPDPDYSAAYVTFGSSRDPESVGYSSVFTIGRGNDVQVAAIESLKPYVWGRDLDELLSDMGMLYKELTGDSQLRWLGPEKGVMHMAIGAVVNALWDIKARRAGLPLWELLAGMPPAELADAIDYRYLSSALSKADALDMLERSLEHRATRVAELKSRGYPAYTTSPGWLGYSDEKLVRLCHEAIAEGFGRIKLKVGANLEDDLRRVRLAREACGPDFPIAVDANQRWEVAEAIDWIRALEPFGLDWVEEPTSPDDVAGHAAIARAIPSTRISSGEHLANRVLARQFLEAGAIGVLQIDSARVGGVNDNIAILLLAAKFGVPVFPHAGGVGLCEAVQHLAFFDYVAVTGMMEDRSIEYVDHLHEHFADPVRVEAGRYWPTQQPGSSQEILVSSLDTFAYPHGPVWSAK